MYLHFFIHSRMFSQQDVQCVRFRFLAKKNGLNLISLSLHFSFWYNKQINIKLHYIHISDKKKLKLKLFAQKERLTRGMYSLSNIVMLLQNSHHQIDIEKRQRLDVLIVN